MKNETNNTPIRDHAGARPLLKLPQRADKPPPPPPKPKPPQGALDSQFWLVWKRDGGPPRHRHATRDLAVAEAERLAALHPGQVFYIYESKLVDRQPSL
jgi:hypothetical protein